MLVDLDVVNTDTKGTFGAKVYYSTTESAIIAKKYRKNIFLIIIYQKYLLQKNKETLVN